MHSKECGDRETGPYRLRAPSQEYEQQYGVRSVQEHIRCVMEPRLIAGNLPVNGVANPGKRVPVGCMIRRESPSQHFGVDAMLNVWVFRNVIVVVVSAEFKTYAWPIQYDSKQQQRENAAPHMETIRVTLYHGGGLIPSYSTFMGLPYQAHRGRLAVLALRVRVWQPTAPF